MPEEEILDIVDEYDHVIAQMPRSQVYTTRNPNYRVVHVFIVNENGEIWLPRRAAQKSTYASAWDFSCAGCVSAGEDYDTAFRREMAEELNIDVDIISYKEIAYLNPYTSWVNCRHFQKIYIVQNNICPNYNPEDFAWYVWIQPKEALRLITMDPIVPQKSSLVPVLRYVFSL